MKLFYLIATILFLNLQYSLLLSENSYFSYKNTKEMQQLIMSDINDLSDSNRILKARFLILLIMKIVLNYMLEKNLDI
ncbi:MAG: hypothetical protein Ct9H90mP18_06340 [Gammaproteobacteria bacterium]|nr:MAG: hypothetical protein Ct9H90mP18_06340 [Gammaproteobacteria bacterium]